MGNPRAPSFQYADANVIVNGVAMCFVFSALWSVFPSAGIKGTCEAFWLWLFEDSHGSMSLFGIDMNKKAVHATGTLRPL